jgi:pilus assembly protein TadC
VAGLEAGLPLDAALTRAAPVRLPWLRERLEQVAGMLRLGADPHQAWRPLTAEPTLKPLVATAIRSSSSGIRLAANLSELAADLRADARSSRLARVQRAAVWVILPLGLCFLPAFVCLGVIPIVIGIASTLRG